MQNLLFSFEGRTSRAPYWYVQLALVIVQGAIVAFMYDTIIRPAMYSRYAMAEAAVEMNVVWLLLIPFYLVGLAVAVKRCHDRDKSGWWLLLGLVPVIGPIVLLVELGFRRGTPGPNRYGPDPLADCVPQSPGHTAR